MKFFFNVLIVILSIGLLDHSVSGVGSDEVTVSVMEGDSVTLNTGVQTKQQEVIKWYFNDTRIAQITGDLSKICTDVQCNKGTERFRDRLKLDHQTGSLTITNTRNTDSGVYQLKVFSSSDSEKTFSVSITTVPGSGLSSGAVAGIVVGVLLVFAAVTAAVVYYRHRMSHAPVPQSRVPSFKIKIAGVPRSCANGGQTIKTANFSSGTSSYNKDR
ncbi:unnamed protein product [Leuciscus chuanchicus]